MAKRRNLTTFLRNTNVSRGFVWGSLIIGALLVVHACAAPPQEQAGTATGAAMSTDYDTWHESEEPVTWEMIVNTMKKNVEKYLQRVSVLLFALAYVWINEFYLI